MGPRVKAFAPGRVNLIGEHTDHEQGLCLPFAIPLGVTVRASPLSTPAIEARALGPGEAARVELPRIGATSPAPPGPPGWRGFLLGAAWELAGAGIELRGCSLAIGGDLPVGAGLSSSAALSVALCLALCGVAGAEPPGKVELARLCSRVENDWTGASTGLLDQLASLLGRERHAQRLDLRAVTVRDVPLELAGATLATLDSGSSRELASSGYNRRRAECRAAARALGVAWLREAGAGAAEALPEPLGRRVRHVVSENARVDKMVAALERRDLEEAGRLLDASHASLRDDFEVSVPEVERTVARAKDAGALGARLIGGGFGGRVLALFPPGVRPPGGALAVSPGRGAGLL